MPADLNWVNLIRLTVQLLLGHEAHATVQAYNKIHRVSCLASDAVSELLLPTAETELMLRAAWVLALCALECRLTHLDLTLRGVTTS